MNAHRLGINAAINLIGQITPLVAGLLSMPALINTLGPARFGILTLAWVVVGYFSLFDLGLGRTLTKFASQAIGEGYPERVPSIARPVLRIMLWLGLLGGAVVFAGTPFLVDDVLKLPDDLRSETKLAFGVMAAGIPVVIVNAGLMGALEAHQHFGLLNAIRVPMSLVTFVGPLLMLHWTQHLGALTATIVVGRLLGAMAMAIACEHVMPGFLSAAPDPAFRVGPFIRYGGWLTVSNVVGPVMLYADRFFVVSLVSAAAVAYYAAPFEIVTRALIIPAAILGVMFAALSEVGARDSQRARRLYLLTLLADAGIMLPVVAAVIFFAYRL